MSEEFDNKTIQNDDQIYEVADAKNDLRQDERTQIIVENSYNGGEGYTAIEGNKMDLDERPAIVGNEVNTDEQHTTIRNDLDGNKEPAN